MKLTDVLFLLSFALSWFAFIVSAYLVLKAKGTNWLANAVFALAIIFVIAVTYRALGLQ